MKIDSQLCVIVIIQQCEEDFGGVGVRTSGHAGHQWESLEASAEVFSRLPRRTIPRCRSHFPLTLCPFFFLRSRVHVVVHGLQYYT
jgi:hypothetical protein